MLGGGSPFGERAGRNVPWDRATPVEAAVPQLDADFELNRLSHRPGDAAM
jgi:hypothetical protein